MAKNPSNGINAVRFAKVQGYKSIKVHTWLNEKPFKVIIEEAQKQSMKVIGHIPVTFEGKPAKDFFVPHFGLIAHAEELSIQTDDYSYEKTQKFASLIKDNGTWLISNLTNRLSISQ